MTIEITQADRDAAKSLVLSMFDGDFRPDAIRDMFTAAFAAHRIAAEAAAYERGKAEGRMDGAKAMQEAAVNVCPLVIVQEAQGHAETIKARNDQATLYRSRIAALAPAEVGKDKP